MRIYLLAFITVFAFGSLKAQETDTLVIKHKKKSAMKVDGKGFSIEIGKTDSVIVSKTKTPVKFPKVNFGFNFEHFDLGLSKYHTNDDFSEPVGYEFLEHETWKTHTFGFDALQFGVRFSPAFKIMLSAGLDWNHMRLSNDDVNIKPDNSTLDYTSDPSAELKKNRFTSRYLRIPLYFEFRSAQLEHGKRFSIVAGPEIGFLIDGKTKQKTKEGDKIKVKDDFNFEPFRYGANVRIGYGGAGLFFKYYMNDVFAENQGPKDYKNLAFGLTFGF